MNEPVAGMVPVGTVVPYAAPVNLATNQSGTTSEPYPPDSAKAYDLRLRRLGWLVCDGRDLAVAGYPELFRALGFVYGKKDDGHFYLPDYRGRFMRGVTAGMTDCSNPDSIACRDPDVSSRDSSNTSGWAGNLPGSVQPDAFQSHQHDYQLAVTSNADPQGKTVAATATKTTPTTDYVEDDKDGTPRHKAETRPKNVYVNFLICYTHRPPLTSVSPMPSFLSGWWN